VERIKAERKAHQGCSGILRARRRIGDPLQQAPHSSAGVDLTQF
jgi:hypothetical protein